MTNLVAYTRFVSDEETRPAVINMDRVTHFEAHAAGGTILTESLSFNGGQRNLSHVIAIEPPAHFMRTGEDAEKALAAGTKAMPTRKLTPRPKPKAEDLPPKAASRGDGANHAGPQVG